MTARERRCNFRAKHLSLSRPHYYPLSATRRTCARNKDLRKGYLVTVKSTMLHTIPYWHSRSSCATRTPYSALSFSRSNPVLLVEATSTPWSCGWGAGGRLPDVKPHSPPKERSTLLANLGCAWPWGTLRIPPELFPVLFTSASSDTFVLLFNSLSYSALILNQIHVLSLFIAVSFFRISCSCGIAFSRSQAQSS